MFSQITKRLQDSIEAVEHIAQSSVSTVAGPSNHHSPPHDPDPSGPVRPSSSQGTDSVRAPLRPSSPSIAETAFSSIRRSLTIQRAPSPSPSPSNADPGHVRSPTRVRSTDRELEPVKRNPSMSLEERLRASFAASEANKSSTTSSVSVIPPTPIEEPTPTSNSFQITDPILIPLPSSPPLRPASVSLSPRLVPALNDPLSPSEISLETSSSSGSTHLEEVTAPSSMSQEVPIIAPVPLQRAPLEPTIDSRSSTPVSSDNTVEEPSTASQFVTPALRRSPDDLSSSPSIEFPTSFNTESSALAERLKTVEQRFSDVSSSFKRLQSERKTADNILRAHTPVKSLSDTESLQAYLQNISSAANTAAEEVRKLTAQLQQQDERMQELRETHLLEGKSRSEQIDKLKKEREEAEALLTAAYSERAAKSTELERSKSEITSLRAEVEKVRRTAKEEEEKRTKAISLLKTVRQKSVKTEKELEDVLQERNLFRAEVAKDKERDKAEQARLEAEVSRVKAEKQRDVARLKDQFDAEVAGLKTRSERENAARQSQFEQEAISLKASHSQELTNRSTRISHLETSVRSLTEERDSLFDLLQLRQAEVESSQSHLESLENQTAELRHLLRESMDRASSLSDELIDAQRRLEEIGDTAGSSNGTRDATTSIIADVERRYESKISDLRERMSTLERERSDAEEEWSRNLQERSREIDRLRIELATRDGQRTTEIGNQAQISERIDALEAELRIARDEKQISARELALAKSAIEQAKESENVARLEQGHIAQKVAALESQLEEVRNREVLLRTSNKTLKEELRRVQTSAALLERQRNPGVGFWAQSNQSRTNVAQDGASFESRAAPGSPRPSSPAQSLFSEGGSVKQSEEEVNLEYLRNIILQFLEHKEMRPNLVRVMSVILRFTPAETRRLASKV